MLGKIKDGQLITLPQSYEHNGISYSNYDLLKENIHRSHDWKDIVETPEPTPTEGYIYVKSYKDTGDNIISVWTAEPLLEPPDEVERPLTNAELTEIVIDLTAKLAHSGIISESDMPEVVASKVQRQMEVVTEVVSRK